MEAGVGSDPDSWAQRIREGDRAAEDEFAAYFYQRVKKMVIARIRDPQQAQDITQEVILRVLDGLRQGRLRHHERLAQYVCGTARHLVCDHFRRNQWSGTADFSILPDREAPLDEALGFRESLGEVRRAFQELAPRDQGIVGMSVVAGLGSSEVARRTGMSAGQVRQRKSRALRRMRSQAGLQLT